MSKSEKIKVFISYASEDYEVAKKLYYDLKNAGTDPWLDRNDLLPGQNWKTAIPQIIRECRYFLLLISKHSVSRRGYIQKEQKIALEFFDELPANKDFILPACLDDTESLDELDERLKDIHWANLSNYEDGLKQIMKVFKISEIINITPKQSEFVNRNIELQTITHQYCPPYLLLVAPSGYGKTELFRAIKCKLERQWLCISITISKQIHSINDIVKKFLGCDTNNYFNFITAEDAGYELGRYILKEILTNQKKVLIQIDDGENIDENIANELLNQFIPAVAETLHQAEITLRIILAGRHILSWMQLVCEIPIKPILLPLFDFDAIYQTVEYFDYSCRNRQSREYIKEFSACLMYFTGGHIKTIFNLLLSQYNLPIKAITKKEKELYEFIKPAIDDTIKHIPNELQDIMKALSVIRRFNVSLLENFIQNNLLSWNQSEFKLEDSLLQTYLVNKKDGFLQDEVTRRLIFIDLRRNNPDRFIEISEKAIAFYESRLNDLKLHRPDIVAVELLFQKLQYLYYKEDGKKENFFNIVPDVLDILVYGRDSISVMESFIQLLNEDWEFRFNLNYLFREKYYDDRYPFNELIKKAVDFLDNIKRGKND